MATQPRSSFIPRQISAGVKRNVHKRRSTFNFMTFVTSILLIGALLLAVGTYFYKDHLEKKKNHQINLLDEERAKFSDADIAAVTELDTKIRAARYRLNNHIAASKIFDALELDTKSQVQFTSFSLNRRPSNDVSVVLLGATEALNTVALQALQFNGSSVMGEAFFEDISNSVGVNEEDESAPNSDKEGVGFNVTTDVEQSKILYDGSPTASVDTQPEETLETDVASDTGENEEVPEDNSSVEGES